MAPFGVSGGTSLYVLYKTRGLADYEAMSSKYPPYINAYGKLSQLFDSIKKASVPTKFSQDFLTTSLGFASSSDRPMISFLKNVGFLDSTNVPTQAYKDYRDDSLSKSVMASQIKASYPELFKANEYAYKLSKTEIQSKLKTILGVSDDDAILPIVAATFSELIKLSDFESAPRAPQKDKPANEQDIGQKLPAAGKQSLTSLGVSYTINLNLPATTEVEVFNLIFKSLKENLLDE